MICDQSCLTVDRTCRSALCNTVQCFGLFDCAAFTKATERIPMQIQHCDRGMTNINTLINKLADEGEDNDDTSIRVLGQPWCFSASARLCLSENNQTYSKATMIDTWLKLHLIHCYAKVEYADGSKAKSALLWT